MKLSLNGHQMSKHIVQTRSGLNALIKKNRSLDSSQLTLADDMVPVTNRQDMCIIKHVPEAVRHQDKGYVMLSIVAYHTAYVI